MNTRTLSRPSQTQTQLSSATHHSHPSRPAPNYIYEKSQSLDSIPNLGASVIVMQDQIARWYMFFFNMQKENYEGTKENIYEIITS